MIAGDEIKLSIAAAPQEQPNIFHPVMSQDKSERQEWLQSTKWIMTKKTMSVME